MSALLHLKPYVYVMFCVLLYIGIKRCFPREVPAARPLISPVAFGMLGIVGLNGLFPHAGIDANAIALGAVVSGAALGWLHASRWRLEYRPASSGLRGAPAPLGRHTELPPEASHRFPADPHAVFLAQLLRQMLIVEPRIPRRHQVAHLVPQRGRQAPRRRPAASAMEERGGAAGFEAAFEPADLPDAQPQRAGGLRVGEPTTTHGTDQPRSVYFLPRQREGLHLGRTLSRCSYPRTLSCSSSTLPTPR